MAHIYIYIYIYIVKSIKFHKIIFSYSYFKTNKFYNNKISNFCYVI